MTISNNYVNRGYDALFNDDVTLFENYCDSCMDKIYQAAAEFKASADTSIFESLSFYKSNLLDDVVFEDADGAKKNFFEKLGAQLVAMCKKFIELINKAINKFKDFVFSTKDNEKKLNALVKSHPELAKEKIQVLCSEGALDFSEMKSLAQLDKEFKEIMKMSEKADVDPNTLKGKWEKAKEKWLNSEDGKLVKAGKVAGGAAAVITLALLIRKFAPDLAESKKKLSDIKNEEMRNDADMMKYLEQTSKFKNSNPGIATTRLAIYRSRKGLWAQAIGTYESRCQKIADAIARAADKFVDKNGDKAAAYKANIAHAAKVANNAEINKAARSEYGKRIGNDAYTNDHKNSPSNPQPKVTNNYTTNNNQKTYNTVNHNDMLGASVRLNQNGGKTTDNNKPKSDNNKPKDQGGGKS